MDAAKFEDWFRQHMQNSVVSRDTETYNHVRKACDELKAKLFTTPASAVSPADKKGS